MPLQSRVCLPEPVNLNHPLAKRLVAWWLCVPGLDGGSHLYDLMGFNHGILTNMTTAGSGWGATTRCGGFGELRFDGVDDSVQSTLALPASTPLLMLSGWFYRTSRTGNPYLWSLGNNGTHPNGSLQVYTDSGVDSLKVGFGASGYGETQLSLNSLPFQTWFHLAVKIDLSQSAMASKISVWLNGITKGLSVNVNNTNTTTIPSGQTVYLGAGSTNNQFWPGKQDDIRIYNRELSVAEIADLYNNSRTGYAGLLNQTKTIPFDLGSKTYNEVGSGGAYPNGTAPYVGSQSFMPQPAGGMGAGTATTAATCNPPVSPTGPLASGSAWATGGTFAGTNAVYNPVIVPVGVLAAGSAIYAKGANPITSSGAWAAGLAVTIGTSFTPSLPSGGVLGSGTTLNTEFFNDIVIVSAGTLANGTAIVNEVLNLVVAPAGGMNAGSASVVTNNSPNVASLGVWSAGSAVCAVADSFVSSGGTFASNGALLQEVDNPQLQLAGLLATSSAVTNELTYPASGPVGALLNGAASVLASHNPGISLAGAWSAGAATYAEIDFFLGSAGAYASGAATLQETCNPQLQVAGNWTNGAATSAVTFLPSALPLGVWGAGSATTSEVDSPAVNPAGLWATGISIAVGHVYAVPVAAAGVWSSGSAATIDDANPQPLGGSWSAGAALVAATYSVGSTTTGLLSTGSSDVAGVYEIILLGGANLAGGFTSRITFTNPTRLTYHRFRIGEIIYVPSAVGAYYLPQAIRGRFSINGSDSWETGLGGFPDQLVLSADEYRGWVGHHALRGER